MLQHAIIMSTLNRVDIARCFICVCAPRPRAMRASRGCAVSRPFLHRFVAAGRAGALMQMSRVVMLVHAGLPCWCFVAQRARRQRFIHGRTTHHWLVCSIVLYMFLSHKQLQMLNLLICSRSSFLFSLSSIFHLVVVPEFHSSCCERAVVWMRIRSCRPALHCAQSIGSQLRPSRRNPRYL